MRKILSNMLVCLSLAMLIAAPAMADKKLSKTAQRQLNTLQKASPETLEKFARNIYNIQYANTAVSDALAEILVQRAVQRDTSYLQALQWSAKSLGALEHNRYAQTLKYVAKNSKIKGVRKHSAAALKHLRRAKETNQYEMGTATVVLD